jgi:Tol biopolymer transport system component
LEFEIPLKTVQGSRIFVDKRTLLYLRLTFTIINLNPKLLKIRLLFFATLVIVLISCKKDPQDPDSLPTSVSLFRASGLDVSWDHSGSNRIAYSVKGVDGYYDVRFAQPDGSNDVPFTENHLLLPTRHIACPYWHPSGEWLLLVVEKQEHPGSSTDALPGFGAYCDIWLMNTSGTKAFKIVEIENDYNHGVIAPRFSHDGKKLVWTDRKTQPDFFNLHQQAGYWTIKTADFRFNPNDSLPEVSNITTIEPVIDAFYECYGYSPDNSRLIFCSNMNEASFLDEHIYTMDTLGGDILRLTFNDYNEHAFYKPDGSKIVWMSSTQNGSGATDWWRMNPDGSNKERLTYFNESNSSQYAGHAVWAGLGHFSPEGNRFIGGRQVNLISQEGEIMMVNILH